MEKSKVVTFRIEESVLEAVDAIAKKQGWYKRSHIIAAGIRLMVELDKRGMAGRALHYYPKLDDVTKLEFEVRRKQVQR